MTCFAGARVMHLLALIGDKGVTLPLASLTASSFGSLPKSNHEGSCGCEGQEPRYSPCWFGGALLSTHGLASPRTFKLEGAPWLEALEPRTRQLGPGVACLCPQRNASIAKRIVGGSDSPPNPNLARSFQSKVLGPTPLSDFGLVSAHHLEKPLQSWPPSLVPGAIRRR